MIVEQDNFTDYFYAFDNDGIHEISLSNAGHIQFSDYYHFEESNISNVTEIEFGDDVVCICADCCLGASNLSSVTFSPNSQPTEIQEYAFYFAGNSQLKRIELPDSIENIGTGCFYGSTIKEITIPAKLKKLETDVFGESEIENIIVPSNVLSIDPGAFWFAEHLSSLTLNEGLEYIGDFAFTNNISLKEVILPDSLKQLDSAAFLCNSELIHIKIPNTLDLSGNPFGGCNKLTSIDQIDIDFEHSQLIPAALGIANKNHSLIIPVDMESYIYQNEENALFEQIYSIGPYCFAYNDDIQRFSIRDPYTRLSSIDEYAFYCANVTDIIIDYGITDIKDDAFCGCFSLSSVTLPSTLINIGLGAFAQDHSLSTINIPESVRTIGSNCFMNCENLKKIVLSGSYENIELPAIEANTFPQYSNIYVTNYNVFGRMLDAPNWKKHAARIIVLTYSNDLNDGICIEIPTQTYTSKPITPILELTIDGELVPQDSYELSYKNNINVGIATVTATAKSSSKYVGTKTVNFKIAAVDISNADIQIETEEQA